MLHSYRPALAYFRGAMRCAYCALRASRISSFDWAVAPVLGGNERPNLADICTYCLVGFPQIYGPLSVQPKIRSIAEKAR